MSEADYRVASEVSKAMMENPPAYPVKFSVGGVEFVGQGMTILDEFARTAMAALIESENPQCEDEYRSIAKEAYAQARAMMRAREAQHAK